jgi:SulP family sulfate permease
MGGLPATGAIARTATNIRSGAKTPVAGVVHAMTLLGVLVVAAPLAKMIPLAVLAAILLVVSYNMGEWQEIPELWRLPKADVAVWFVTFALTVLSDLTVAVGVGMVLAALLFILHVSDTTTVAAVTEDYLRDGRVHSLHGAAIPDYVAVFRVHGPLLFGTGDKLRPIIDRADQLPAIVILRLRDMTAIDATGIRAIEELAMALRVSGRRLILCGAHRQPARVLESGGVHRHIGNGNVRPNFHEALRRAGELNEQDVLAGAHASSAESA